MSYINKKNKILIFIGGFLFITLITTSSIFYVIRIINQLPPLDDFSSRKISQSTKIYDRTGEFLLYEISGDEKRTILPFEDIPENIKLATLAVEDPYFYTQPAFSIRGIIRAFVQNLKRGQITQGGSTITQQLVKSTLLTPERTYTRKIKELILAIELESKYSKDDILEAYLNQIPYGSNAYGIEAASQTFLNKSATEITLAESAALASLTPAPSRFSPWGEDKDLIFNRKDNTLRRMFDLGLITEEELESALDEEIVFAPPSLGSIFAPHFVLSVQNELIRKYGDDFIRTEGLRVITTLDVDLQKIAEEVVEEGAKRNNELYGGSNAALVLQNPKTGEILSLVGSRNYFDDEIDGNFNVITQALRQPGSALKPFIYLEAIKKGFGPNTIIFDTHTEFVSNNPSCPAEVNINSRSNPTCFNPENFDGVFRGPVTLAAALAQSINVPAVKTLYLAGFDDVIKTLVDLGITTLQERWRYGLSLVLGGGEIRPIELTNAYATLARNGEFLPHSLIKSIETSDGDIIYEVDIDPVRVYEENAVKHINKILSDVELRSGLFQSSINLTTFPNREVALKTGTTNDYRDAWAFGYSPSFVIGVWAGNNNNDRMHQYGSSLMAAIPMWHSFLERAFNETNVFPEQDVFSRPNSDILDVKPMMNGRYIYNPLINGREYPQLHSILYWVNKEDPLGDIPRNPGNDSQFNNWQRSVHIWAERNIPNFINLYNQEISYNDIVSNIYNNNNDSTLSDIVINSININNGDFISSPFEVDINITSIEVFNIDIILNGQNVHKSTHNGGNINLSEVINNNLNPQNKMEIIIEDSIGNEEVLSLILYHED